MQANGAEPSNKTDLKSSQCLKSSHSNVTKSNELEKSKDLNNKLQSEAIPKPATDQLAANDNAISEEPKKNLLLEARHTLSIAVAKQRRASVSTSLFLPKELARKRSEIMVYRQKNLLEQKFRSTQQQKQHMRQKRQCRNIEHPRSFPIQRNAIDRQQLRTAFEVLRNATEEHQEHQDNHNNSNNDNEQFTQEPVSVSCSTASSTTSTTQDAIFATIINEDPDLESLRLEILTDINSNNTLTQSENSSSSKGIAETYPLSLDMLNNIKQELFSSDDEDLIESEQHNEDQRPSVIMAANTFEKDQLKIENLVCTELANCETVQPEASNFLNSSNATPTNRISVIRRSISFDNQTSDVNTARILCEQNLFELKNDVTKTLNAFKQNPLIYLLPSQQETCTETSHETSGNWNVENIEPITSTQSHSIQRTEAQVEQQEQELYLATENINAVDISLSSTNSNEKEQSAIITAAFDCPTNQTQPLLASMAPNSIEKDQSALLLASFGGTTNQRLPLTLESSKEETMTVDTRQDSLTMSAALRSNILKRRISEMSQASYHRNYETTQLLKQQQTNKSIKKWKLKDPETVSSIHSLSMQTSAAGEEQPLNEQSSLISQNFVWLTNTIQHLSLQSTEERPAATAVNPEFNAQQAAAPSRSDMQINRVSEIPQLSYYRKYETSETPNKKWRVDISEPTSSTQTLSNINDVDTSKKVEPFHFSWPTNQTNQPLSLQSTEERVTAAIIPQASLTNCAPLRSNRVGRHMSETHQISYYKNQTDEAAKLQRNITIRNCNTRDIAPNSSTQELSIEQQYQHQRQHPQYPPLQQQNQQQLQQQHPQYPPLQRQNQHQHPQQHPLKHQKQQHPQRSDLRSGDTRRETPRNPIGQESLPQQHAVLRHPKEQHQGTLNAAAHFSNSEMLTSSSSKTEIYQPPILPAIFPWPNTQTQPLNLQRMEQPSTPSTNWYRKPEASTNCFNNEHLNMASRNRDNVEMLPLLSQISRNDKSHPPIRPLTVAWPSTQSQPLNLQNRPENVAGASRDSQLRAQDFNNCSSLHNSVQCRKVSATTGLPTSYNKAPRAKRKIVSCTQSSDTCQQVAKNSLSDQITNSNTHNPATYSNQSYAPDVYNSVFRKWLTSTATTTTTTKHTTTYATNHNVYQQQQQHFPQNNLTAPTITNCLTHSISEQLTYPTSLYVQPSHPKLISLHSATQSSHHPPPYPYQQQEHQTLHTILHSPYSARHNTIPTPSFPSTTTTQYPLSPPLTPTLTHLQQKQQKHKLQQQNRAIVAQNQKFHNPQYPLVRPETLPQLEQSTPANMWSLRTNNEQRNHSHPYFQHIMNQDSQMYYGINPDQNKSNLTSHSDNFTVRTTQPQPLPQPSMSHMQQEASSSTQILRRFDFQSSSFANYETSLLNKYTHQQF